MATPEWGPEWGPTKEARAAARVSRWEAVDEVRGCGPEAREVRMPEVPLFSLVLSISAELLLSAKNGFSKNEF